MSWLHTWCGLACGWLLCAIFLTGTLSVFREPITRWMQAAPLSSLASPDAPLLTSAQRLHALRLAQQHLQQAAPGASIWRIALPRTAADAVEVHARGVGIDVQAWLDARTGAPRSAPRLRATEGGRHFMSFHYSLQGGIAGFWIVGLVSMGMLVALVSGVIVHRRIFQDFFTFRPGKGQRSWMDAHNAASVLTLPFLFMIVYTGLAHFYTSYMPWPLTALYGQHASAHSRYQQELAPPRHSDMPAAPPAAGHRGGDMAALADQARRLLHAPVAEVLLQRPEAGAATVRMASARPDAAATATSGRMLHSAAEVTFDASTGALLQPPAQYAGRALVSQVYPVISALHLVTFGGWTVKWLYFLCGLAGTAAIATGSLLFAVKRRSRSGQEWGTATPRMYRVIDALNVAALAGAALASVAYLYANRLLPLALSARADWEIRGFLAIWALSLVHALLRPARSAWNEQLWAIALLCLALPGLNALTTGQHLGIYLAHGDGQRAGVELVCMALGLLAAWMAWRHARRAAPAERRR